jgi:tetratricopeptide (TPR) repeat protein
MQSIAALSIAVLLAATALVLRFARHHGLLQMAKYRLASSDPLGAASLFEEAGSLARAAELCAEGGDRLRAAEIHLKLKRPDAAIEALRGGKAEEIEKGAALLESARALEDRTRAVNLAVLARSASLAGLAARCFERAGSEEEARAARLQEARALATQGHPLEAAALYERLGELRAAAAALAESARREPDAFKKHEVAEKASLILKALGDLPGAAEALAIGGDIEAGAKLLLDANDVAGAGQLFQWNGLHARAGELFEKVGDFRSAARAWGHAGDMKRSAAMLERAGDTIGAARLLMEARDPKAAAEVHLRAGSTGSAAEILAGAGEVDTALKIYVDSGMIDNAVELLCKRGRPRDAAALLQQRGEVHRAAALLAESGDLEERARLLEAQGDFDGAAQAYLDLGQPQDAKRALGRVPRFTSMGRFLQARACMATLAYEEAAQHFVALLDGPPPGVERIDVLYGLARAFEAMDHSREAIATLDEVLAIDASYRDAAFRLKLLRAGLQGPSRVNLTPIPPLSGPVLLTPGLVLGSGDTSTMPPSPPGEEGEGRSGVPERYVVEKELGRGAMGVVYRALDSQLGRTVAIKVLMAQAGADPRIREYFLREARAVAQLIHPNIVTLFDAGLEGTSPYLVMELVEGDDLRTQLQKSRLEIKETLLLISGVALALDYAHSRKIVHRDVKPENILVSSDGTAKLMDFGVAHVMQSGERHATVIGTPVYMAPEQIRGENIGGWTDTYALGAVLYECLIGQPPFDPKGALYHHVSTPSPDPRVLRPEIPDRVAETVLSCLAKSKEGRPASAKVLSDTLLSMAHSIQAA